MSAGTTDWTLFSPSKIFDASPRRRDKPRVDQKSLTGTARYVPGSRTEYWWATWQLRMIGNVSPGHESRLCDMRGSKSKELPTSKLDGFHLVPVSEIKTLGGNSKLDDLVVPWSSPCRGLNSSASWKGPRLLWRLGINGLCAAEQMHVRSVVSFEQRDVLADH